MLWIDYIRKGHTITPDNPIEYHKVQLATAIDQNKIDALRSLLQAGGIDFVDQKNSTLIHLAIDLARPDVLNLLLDTDGAPIDAEGEQTERYGVESPLLFALRMQQLSMARKLIEKGADIHLVDELGYSALYYCFEVHKALDLAKILFEKGVDVNEGGQGEKLLVNACWTNKVDAVHILLYYGVDVSKPTKWEITPFDVASPEIKEVLFDHIFDGEKYDIRLKTLVRMSTSFLERIVDYISDVWYLEEYEELLPYEVQMMEPYCLQVLMERFKHGMKYILKEYCLLAWLSSSNSRCVENFTILVESDFFEDVVKNINAKRNQMYLDEFIRAISSQDENTQHEKLSLLKKLLENGVHFQQYDVCEVYLQHGFCSLFKYMIMDPNLTRTSWNLLVPRLIYDVKMPIKTFLLEMINPRNYQDGCLLLALELFCDQRLKEHCLKHHGFEDVIEEMPAVPLLVELARNVAREHLVNVYKVENFREFSELLEKLPVDGETVKLLTFERKLYNIKRICKR